MLRRVYIVIACADNMILLRVSSVYSVAIGEVQQGYPLFKALEDAYIRSSMKRRGGRGGGGASVLLVL